ncbi:MAG: family 16 glycoside hydrolase [Verrucomicrobiales bacterium]
MTTLTTYQANSNELRIRAAKVRTDARKNRWIAVLAMAMLCLGAHHSTGETEGDTGNASPDLARGLVGRWMFDEGNGSLARDVSGRDNHGTIMGGAKWIEGKIGGALQFDGTDDFVSIPNESDFDITGGVTISAWIRVESFTNPWQAIVTKGDRAWRLHRANETKSVGFACSDLSREQVGDLDGNQDVADGQWHHVAGVLDGTKTSIFVDGALDASADSSPSISVNDYSVLIGANAQVTGRLFHGLIDDVRIYDRALSVDELRALGKEGGGAVSPPGKPVAQTPATAPASPPLSFNAGEFQKIFDGNTLEGWNALNMSYWSIRDGAITGQSTKENPCTSNQFMIWQGGEVADFELKLQFRVNGNGCNSGVQFRSKMREDGLAIGYQADIYQSGGYLGGVCDELHSRNGPELLSANGTKTVIDKSGQRTRTKIDTEATLKKWPEWNDYHIIAKGHQMILRINGVTASELIDNEEAHFDLKGILGVQLRSGEPMTVQFKDIYLKQLELEEGFTPLFDGKTLDGWHLMNGAKFVVADGVMQHQGGLGWLRSEKQYSDFVLRLEFRFLKSKQDGGVFVRSNTQGDNWPDRKYEVQIENTERMAKIFGADYDLDVELAQKALKPTGEWNAYEIVLIGSTIEVRLNGELVSKSGKMDGLKRGYIGLQGENGAHEYRNFRIKDLGK